MLINIHRTPEPCLKKSRGFGGRPPILQRRKNDIFIFSDRLLPINNTVAYWLCGEFKESLLDSGADRDDTVVMVLADEPREVL